MGYDLARSWSDLPRQARQVRLLTVWWVCGAIGAGLVIRFLPSGPQRWCLDGMWVIALAAVLGYAVLLWRQRESVATSTDLASDWLLCLIFGVLTTWLYSSWVALGLGVLVIAYTLVLLHRARAIVTLRLAAEYRKEHPA